MKSIAIVSVGSVASFFVHQIATSCLRGMSQEGNPFNLSYLVSSILYTSISLFFWISYIALPYTFQRSSLNHHVLIPHSPRHPQILHPHSPHCPHPLNRPRKSNSFFPLCRLHHRRQPWHRRRNSLRLRSSRSQWDHHLRKIDGPAAGSQSEDIFDR